MRTTAMAARSGTRRDADASATCAEETDEQRCAQFHQGYSGHSHASIGGGRRDLDVRGVSRGRRMRGHEGRGLAAARLPHADPGTVRDAHGGGERGVGQAPAGPDRDPGAALPRHRPGGEQLLERRRRLLRHRRRRLRQADDGDPPCRLPDDRAADVHRLRRQEARRPAPAAAAAHVRRCAGRLVGRRRRHPERS